MSELQSSELQQFRDMVKRFLEKEIKPFYNQWEKDGIIVGCAVSGCAAMSARFRFNTGTRSPI